VTNTPTKAASAPIELAAGTVVVEVVAGQAELVHDDPGADVPGSGNVDEALQRAYWSKEVSVMSHASKRRDVSDASTAEDRWRSLPTRIRLEDTIAAKESEPPPDPEAGRNTEQDFMLRYSG
jgi:hypothetical protein